MGLPFNAEQFLQVFAEYNRAVWPLQLVFYSVAGLTLLLAVRKRPSSDRIISGALALLWLWMGAVYHLTFFAVINKAAVAFGALFILQAFLFFTLGVLNSSLAFRLRAGLDGFCGAALFAYSLILYPALGHLLGHEYPAAPTFGLPCPTTIFTFGMLLCAEGRVPARLTLIPLVWSVIGTAAVLYLGMTEDFGLLAAGVIGTTLIALRNRNLQIHSVVSCPS
jgi:hypothetical protein